jgi:chaperone required for assembly of F1-ATPase
MPLTRLVVAAIDLGPERRAQAVGEAAAYAATDLVCHRAEAPADLAARQHREWQPLLDWLVERWDARLDVTAGVVPVDQPADALRALRAAVDGFDDFGFVALHALTAACDSLVIALAAAEGRIDGDEAWRLSQIDESHQAEAWGGDPDAAAQRERLREEILAAARFLALSRGHA